MAKQGQLIPEVPDVIEEPVEEVNEPEQMAAKKLNRHVVIALNHMRVRRTALLEKKVALGKEISELDAAMVALDPARSAEKP